MAKKQAKKQVEEEVVEFRELTKVEQFYIAENSGKLSVEQIAEDLGIELELVVANMPKKNRKQDSRMQTLLAKKPRHGAVVMTPAASELSDETKGQRKNPKVGPHIFQPYGTE